jgi:hypothetical protein
MVRVACTHPMETSGMTYGGGVLCSRVAHDPFLYWRIWVKVDICRSETYKCHVVRKPQLGQTDSNHRCFSVKKTRSTILHRS